MNTIDIVKAQVGDAIGKAASEIGDSATLTDLGFDSLDRTELAIKLEEQFRVEVPDRMLENERFDAIEHIAAWLDEQISAQPIILTSADKIDGVSPEGTVAGLEPIDVSGMITITRFRKLPVEIDAVKFQKLEDGMVMWECWPQSVPLWLFEAMEKASTEPGAIFIDYTDMSLKVMTLEGPLTASAGDMIIRGTKGELYPCKPDVFAGVYEPVIHAAELSGDLVEVSPSDIQEGEAFWTGDGFLHPGHHDVSWLPANPITNGVVDDGKLTHLVLPATSADEGDTLLRPGQKVTREQIERHYAVRDMAITANLPHHQV